MDEAAEMDSTFQNRQARHIPNVESWQLDEKVFGRGIRRRELNTGRQRGREWMWLLFVGSLDLMFDERKAWDVMESEKGLGTEAGTQQPSSSQQHRQAVNSEPNSKYRGRQKHFTRSGTRLSQSVL